MIPESTLQVLGVLCIIRTLVYLLTHKDSEIHKHTYYFVESRLLPASIQNWLRFLQSVTVWTRARFPEVHLYTCDITKSPITLCIFVTLRGFRSTLHILKNAQIYIVIPFWFKKLLPTLMRRWDASISGYVGVANLPVPCMPLCIVVAFWSTLFQCDSRGSHLHKLLRHRSSYRYWGCLCVAETSDQYSVYLCASGPLNYTVYIWLV